MIFIIISLWIIYFIGLFIAFLFKRRWVIRRVKCTSDSEKLCYINQILDPFGFEFDVNQDIVISKNDCWQRDFGYTNFYDYKAPFFCMVLNSLPIDFTYDDKEYRIEFWKGQYGLTTGAEIGVYIKDSKHSKIYRAATDEERLNMQFSLVKNCKLFSRCDKSWWLTGFDIGVFSKPKKLKMSVCICFDEEDMMCAFVEALIKAGYASSDIDICDNMVCFDYCCSNNYKPNWRYRIIKIIAQICNFINCKLYLCFTRFFNRTLDRLTYVMFMMPCLCKLIIKLSIPRRKKFRKQKSKF